MRLEDNIFKNYIKLYEICEKGVISEFMIWNNNELLTINIFTILFIVN